LRENPKTHSVEANQPLLCANPQITVFGLSKGGHAATQKSAIASPSLAQVLRHHSERIHCEQGGRQTNDHDAADDHLEKTPAGGYSLKGGIQISQRQLHFPFEAGSFRSLRRRT